MITKNSDPNIYCDYCKHDYRRPDGSFKAKVRSAVIRIDYKQYKGHVARRFLCETCVKNITAIVIGGSNQFLTIKWGFDYSGAYQSENIYIPTQVSYEYGIAEYNIAEYTSGVPIKTCTSLSVFA